MRLISRPSAWGLFLLLLVLPWVSGCDQGTLESPDVSDGLFRSYVSIGNSITAGFQSGGINENTQNESFAVLLSEQMNTPFTIPVLPPPGCPPPLKQAFPPVRISETPCAGRTPASTSTINNVAVPAAAVVDVLDNTQSASNPNALTSFILGGQTQIEAAKRANPTFVTAWIGNNDVLSAALAGESTLATSVDSFQARYSRMVNKLESIERLEGAVFLGAANVTLIPHLSRGAAYREAKKNGALPSNLKLKNCKPPSQGGDGDIFLPFRHGATLIGVAQEVASLGGEVVIDCSKDRTVEETVRENFSDSQVIDAEEVLDNIPDEIEPISRLTRQETTVLENRVSAFNQIIKNQVGNSYGYVNPNPLFEANSDKIPSFPALGSSEPFGPLFSLDGVHPSASAHRLVANEIIDEINATYDANLSKISSSQ